MSISMKWLWKLICKAREGYSPTTPSEKKNLVEETPKHRLQIHKDVCILF